MKFCLPRLNELILRNFGNPTMQSSKLFLALISFSFQSSQEKPLPIRIKPDKSHPIQGYPLSLRIFSHYLHPSPDTISTANALHTIGTNKCLFNHIAGRSPIEDTLQRAALLPPWKSEKTETTSCGDMTLSLSYVDLELLTHQKLKILLKCCTIPSTVAMWLDDVEQWVSNVQHLEHNSVVVLGHQSRNLVF